MPTELTTEMLLQARAVAEEDADKPLKTFSVTPEQQRATWEGMADVGGAWWLSARPRETARAWHRNNFLMESHYQSVKAEVEGLELWLVFDRGITNLGDPWPLHAVGISRVRVLGKRVGPQILGNKTLTELFPLQCLPELKHLDLLYCTALTDISGLAGLDCLTRLDLSGCTGLTDLTGLSGLPSLTHLDLSDCTGLTDLSGLEGHACLTHLTLSGCTGLTDLKGLQGLSSLTHLTLSRCTRLTDLKGLEDLSSLTHLTLSRCKGLTDLTGVQALSGLTHLDLSYHSELADLMFVTQLSSLTHLDVSGCAGLTDLTPLARMANLRHLALGHRPAVTALSAWEGIQELCQITTLTLDDCKSLEDLTGLQELTALTHLDLSRNSRLADLSPLKHLSQLTHLRLFRCSALESLRPIRKLESLVELDIVGCDALRSLNPLRKLRVGVKMRGLPTHLKLPPPIEQEGAVAIDWATEKQPRPPEPPPPEFFWLCWFVAGRVAWASHGPGSSNDRSRPEACKFLRQHHVFEVEFSRALVHRTHLEVLQSRLEPSRFGRWRLSGQPEDCERYPTGRAHQIWTPVFEDWQFAPDEGERFESSQARLFYVSRRDGVYFNDERGWGAQVPEALEEDLRELIEAVETEAEDIALYDFRHPDSSALGGLTPNSDAWNAVMSRCLEDSLGWQLFGI